MSPITFLAAWAPRGSSRREFRNLGCEPTRRNPFREIGERFGLLRSRAFQIYHASIKRIELKKRGGDIWPEYSIGERALQKEAASNVTSYWQRTRGNHIPKHQCSLQSQ